jgi:hypothetical protein
MRIWSHADPDSLLQNAPARESGSGHSASIRTSNIIRAHGKNTVKLSEFQRALATEFGGAYGRVLAHDLALRELDSRTADEALAAGVSPRAVWLALCKEADVPQDRWHGVGVRPPRN